MTNEHNIKVGDRVAVKRSYTLIANGYENVVPTGEVGIVENVDGEELLVECPAYYCALALMASDVEPIQPLGRRTAFLTRLQSLLREFDARINDHDGYKLYIDFGIHGEGSERIVYSDTEGEITADNIMDFDKEGV